MTLAKPASTTRHTIILLLGNITAQLLSAGLYLAFARNAGPADYGRVAACILLITLAVSVVEFGGTTYLVRGLASGSMAIGEFTAWFFSKGLLVLLLSVPVALVCTFSTDTFSGPTLGAAAILFVCMSLSLVAAAPLRAELRFFEVSIVLVISRIPSLCLALPLSNSSMSVPTSLTGLLALSSLLETLLYLLARRPLNNIKQIYHPLKMFTNPYRGGTSLGAGSIVASGGSLDVTLVQLASNSRAAGEYAAVNRWMGPIGLVAAAATQAAFPRLCSADSSDRFTLLKRSVIASACAIPGLIFVGVFAPQLVEILLGDSYVGSVTTLRLLCIAIAFSITIQPVNAALIAWRCERPAATSLAVGLAVQLAAQAILSHHLGASGAALGAIIGQCLTLGLLALSVFLTRRSWSRSHRDFESFALVQDTQFSKARS